MRTAITSLLIGVSLMAACDNGPTAPAAHRMQTGTKPSESWMRGVTWTATKLSFRPAAINDDGMIVGTQNASAVRWQNGTVATLGASSLPQCQGFTDGTAISRSGIAAGTAGGCI